MLGKWSNEHIVMSYINGIPLPAVLARGGFQHQLHMLPRSTIEPHQDLLDCIFLGIDRLHERKEEVCSVLHEITA